MSGASWDGVRGSERALTESLLRHTDVLWVDPPVSPATPRRYRRFAGAGPSWRPAVTEQGGGCYRLTPVVLPGLTRQGIRLTTWPLVRQEIRWALRQLGRRPVAVLSASLDDVLGGWPSGTTTVLYGTDDWVAGAELMGQSSAKLLADERRAVAAADIVLAVTPELADRWRGLGADPALLPNGCDPESYLAVDDVTPADLPAGFPTRVAGVVGQLNDRLDADLLAAVADTGVGLLLVGPRDPGWLPGRWGELVRRPNVHHTGAVPFAELPRWLARMDVGLTPYTDTAFNRASFPLKTLEYLAAGRPVVGSDLPATRGLATESRDVTAVAGAAEFARRVIAAAGIPRTADVVQRRRRVVAVRHSWAARAVRLATLLGLPTDPDRPTGHDGPAAAYRTPELAATNRTSQPIHTVTDRGAGHTDIPRSTG
ncbi:MAG TPA: glycosyltransferase [Pseudonocardiaceae bacterium]|nr:glycosyltransferase [Pseudonocardiaceae bacterium]